MQVPLALAAFALLASIPAAANTAKAVGVQIITPLAPERGTTLDVTLWYPAASGGTPVLMGDTPIFKGEPAQRGAPVAPESFPLVLLAHGGLRAAPHLGDWIAARLAAGGYVVAVPHQAGPATEQDIWLRPADLSAVLTAVENDPVLATHIDGTRVGVLGVLRGGTSALALVGARLDAERYAHSCDEGELGLDCAWFKKTNVDLHGLDAARVGRPNRDPRIKVAIAVDPELSTFFTPASLAGIPVPVEIINLGQSATVAPGLYASSLASAIPHARYETVPDATVFGAFSECKPSGPAILRDDGDDDAICIDRANRTRAEIHAQLAAMIGAALRLHLQTAP